MSKSLRVFLLSMLVVVLAASSVMAATADSIKFKWVGGTTTTTNYWGHARNWQLFDSADQPTSYDKYVGKIKRLKNDIEFYPGSFVAADGVSLDVYVVISKDANIEMTNVSNVAGGLEGITSLDISAKVSLDMGSESWFHEAPSIMVNSGGALKVNGDHANAFRIVKDTKWEAVSADLFLYMPVTFAANSVLSLDVSYGALTIGNKSVLGYNAVRKTKITIRDRKSSPTARLVFDVPFTSSGVSLDIVLSGTANRVDTLQDVTLNVWSVDVKQAISTDVNGSKSFVKGGSATLTLNKAANTYGREGIPVISADKFTVSAGALKITGAAGSAPLGRYDSKRVVTFTVAAGASLDLGPRTISADVGASIDITARGEVNFRSMAIDCGDNYDSGELKLNAGVIARALGNGFIRFGGSQAVTIVSGDGTLESTASGAMLILNGDSEDIKYFSGTIKGLNIGINQEWNIVPFLTNAKDGSSIDTLYVFGPDGSLYLDSGALKSVREKLKDTNIYLRTNMPKVSDYAKLRDFAIGELRISGDIALNVVSVDGTRSADKVGAIFFEDGARLAVNRLGLHANADTDFSASSKQTTNSNVYTNAYAIDISGHGTFAPKAIVNGAANNAVKVGQKDSITVENAATLELRGGVTFPANNGLLLMASSIDVENNTRISGDFIIDGDSIIKVSLTGSNARDYVGEENINTAAIVVGETFKISGDTRISVDITELVDAGKFLGKMYSLVGFNNRDIGDKKAVSVDVTAIGDYGASNGKKAAVNLGLSSKVIWAQLARWMIKPVVFDWKFTDGDTVSSLGSPTSQFTAEISYGLSDDITSKDALLNCLVPSMTLYYDGNEATPQLTDGDARQNVKTSDGEPLGFFQFENDKKNHKLVLSGTSYVTELEVGITLSWDMTSKSIAVYNDDTVRVTTSTGGSLGEEFAHNGKIASEDLLNLVDERRTVKNPTKVSDDVPPARSEDVYITPTVTPTSPTTVFETGADANFEFSIEGMTIAAPSTSAPVLVNGVYMWFNGLASTDRYVINDETVTDLQILVNGQPIDMTNVVVTDNGNGGVNVSVPVSLLGSSNGYLPEYKTIELTAKAVSDNATIHIEGPTVTITAKYAEGTVNEGQKNVTFTTGRIPTSEQQLAEYTMTDPVSYDVTGNVPAGISWDIAGGVIAYSLAQDTPAGVYDMTVNVWNAEGAYKYTFTVTVNEGFKVNYEELYDIYAGRNYEAHFTTANAPAGTVTWNFTTDVNWLYTANSGDMFIVYGQLPPYENDEDNDEANSYSYTVTATVGTETASQALTLDVSEDDTDPAEVHEDMNAAAGTVTSTGDIHTVYRNYNVAIALNDGYYGEIDFHLPYWLVATPTMNADEDVTGYTISFRNGAEVARGTPGVVRFDDPEAGVVQWAVTFADDTTPAPGPDSGDQPGPGPDSGDQPGPGPDSGDQPGPGPDSGDVPGSEFMYSVSGSTTVSVALAARDTSVTITPRNVLGTVSYTSSASWVTVNSSTGVVTINPTDSSLVSSTPHTVTITLTDSGRTTANTQTVTLTITVTGVAPETFRIELRRSSYSFDIYNSQLSFDIDAIVRPVNNQGTVSYAISSVSPSTGLTVTLSNGVVTLTATRTDTYTVTVTGTDSAGQTARANITVRVTGSTGSVGSSGGGCDAGFGALALALAVPLFLRRRRS